jgi:hypothetical protein
MPIGLNLSHQLRGELGNLVVGKIAIYVRLDFGQFQWLQFVLG